MSDSEHKMGWMDNLSQRTELWLEENHRDIFATKFRVKRVLFSGKSDFQRVDVVETAGHGKMLLNDGLVQVSERDEFVYHDMIAHVPLFLHPDPQRVLVIGGGDGGTVREVLRHDSVERCRLVEIDEMVVEACRKHIPQTSACLDDPRAEVTIADGVRFAAETEERFDVVIVDSSDPIGPSEPLFGPEFYTNVKRILSEQGILVAQGETPFYEIETQKSILNILHTLFEVTGIYNYSNLTYPGGLWSFLYASRGIRPVADFHPERVRASGLEFQYYGEEVHRAAFTLPAFQRKALSPFLGGTGC